jgi:hypothetical protein
MPATCICYAEVVVTVVQREGDLHDDEGRVSDRGTCGECPQEVGMDIIHGCERRVDDREQEHQDEVRGQDVRFPQQMEQRNVGKPEGLELHDSPCCVTRVQTSRHMALSLPVPDFDGQKGAASTLLAVTGKNVALAGFTCI